MGPCIYTPGQKNAYIPINHTDLQHNRLDWQLTEEDIKEQFSRLSNTKIVMHNGKFDYQVIKCTCGIGLNIYWDTIIAARLLDENERAGLKEQYITKIDPSIEKYSIDHLFKIDYEYVDPDVFALYAATDSFMTYQLYLWQLKKFESGNYDKLFNLFINTEMPLIEVVAEMELTGVCLDLEYAKKLSKKYHNILDSIDNEIAIELHNYDEIIANWKMTSDANKPIVNAKTGKEGKSKAQQLEDPISLGSPTQLAIFLYDILKVGVIDKKQPRGTGADILEQIDNPLCKLILKKRTQEVIINTFVDKLPSIINPSDNKLHGHYNQLGTDTGRFSSQDPNLQNIPSHDYSIRLMFQASPGYTMLGCDYSQQEPRTLAQMSGDDNMIDAYKNGKDLYATIATSVYHNNYEDNLEHYPDGSMYPEGKKRRSSVKSLLLGIMYGMGTPTIAENLGVSKEEAQSILDSFFDGFPKVKNWMDESLDHARKFGYVEDVWGRRRRLPDISLPEYSITYNGVQKFNPILGTSSIDSCDENNLKDKYFKLIKQARFKKEKDKIVEQAKADNISIRNNGGFIARSERQIVNARIQGSAATMTKRAMNLVYRDPKMIEYGFRLLIPVHDELIGECPKQYEELAMKRLSEIMIQAAKPEVIVPMKCDADSFSHWYSDVYAAEIKKQINKYINDGMTYNCAKEKLLSTNIELSNEWVDYMYKYGKL